MTAAHPRAGAGLAVGAVCLVLIWTVDAPIARWTAHGQPSGWSAFFETITDIGLAGPFLYGAAALFLAARLLFLQALPNRIAYLYKRLSDSALYLLVTMALSGILVHMLKFATARLRPKHLLNDGDYGLFFYGGDWSNNSFPSGHAQTVFNAAMVLTMLFPKSGYVVLPLAGLIALSRVMVSAHYPSDVLMGSFIGVLGAVIVFERWFEHLRHPIYPPGPA